jgi:hypothetical protein
LDQRHHQCRALGHEDGVSQPLGLLLQVLNRAQPALLTEQAELVEWSRALVLHPQALRQQEKPSFERHRGEVLGPYFVIDQDRGVITVHGIHRRQAHNRIGVAPELVQHQRRHERIAPLLDVSHDSRTQVLALVRRLRNVCLWRPLRQGRNHP